MSATTTHMSSPIVDKLKQWSSCDVSDGLSKLGYTHGGFLEGLHMYSPGYKSSNTKIVGQAFTVKFSSKEDDAPRVSGNYIDQIPKGAIVFISQPTPHINACYGGLMSLRAQYLGAAGVVIDGCLRDIQEHRDLNFPVSPAQLPESIPRLAPYCCFARGTGTTAGGAVCFPSEVGVPIKLQSSIQSANFNPGDFIIADQDGVVALPSELAEKVLELIPGIAGADEKAAEAIRGGMSVQEALRFSEGNDSDCKAGSISLHYLNL